MYFKSKKGETPLTFEMGRRQESSFIEMNALRDIK